METIILMAIIIVLVISLLVFWLKNSKLNNEVKSLKLMLESFENHLTTTKTEEDHREKIPEDATHVFEGVYFKKGPNRYSFYYSRGWRESAVVTNDYLQFYPKVDFYQK